MRKDVRDRWAEALESGEFEQVDGWLATPFGYCADGVLCRLAVDDGVLPEPVLARGDALTPNVYIYNGEAMYLPARVREWAGGPQEPSVPVEALPEELCHAVLDAVSSASANGDPEKLTRFETASEWKTHELNDAQVPFPLIARVVRYLPTEEDAGGSGV